LRSRGTRVLDATFTASILKEESLTELAPKFIMIKSRQRVRFQRTRKTLDQETPELSKRVCDVAFALAM